MEAIRQIQALFKAGTDSRAEQVKKNVMYSFLLKIASILMSFLLVPVTIDYLNPTRYGIWLTLSSILGWVNYFDLGLGNGLKNKLTEALAKGDHRSATVYVSTSYALLSLIALGFIILLGITFPFLHWDTILNVPETYRSELDMIILIVSVFFGLNFVVKLITIILHSYQKIAWSDFLMVAANMLSLLIIYLLVATHQKENFLLVSIIFSASPCIVMLIATVILFMGKYKAIAPRFSAIDFSYSKALLGLGIQFFIIQLSCLVVFSTSNLLISYLFSPKDVTEYNIAYKYFSIIIMGSQILMAPLWPAYTEAYCKGDFPWIRSSVNKMLKIWVVILIGVGIMLAGASLFYRLWVGESVIVPFGLSFTCALYALICCWVNIFMYVINGTGKIRLQTYYTLISTFLMIPLCVLLSRFMGPSGIVAGNIIALLPGAILAPWQYYKIVNQKGHGIWLK